VDEVWVSGWVSDSVCVVMAGKGRHGVVKPTAETVKAPFGSVNDSTGPVKDAASLGAPDTVVKASFRTVKLLAGAVKHPVGLTICSIDI